MKQKDMYIDYKDNINRYNENVIKKIVENSLKHIVLEGDNNKHKSLSQKLKDDLSSRMNDFYNNSDNGDYNKSMANDIIDNENLGYNVDYRSLSNKTNTKRNKENNQLYYGVETLNKNDVPIRDLEKKGDEYFDKAINKNIEKYLPYIRQCITQRDETANYDNIDDIQKIDSIDYKKLKKICDKNNLDYQEAKQTYFLIKNLFAHRILYDDIEFGKDAKGYYDNNNNIDFNPYTNLNLLKKSINAEKIISIKRNTINTYLDQKYGIKIQIPGFSLGSNKKIGQKLVVNFTSGNGCPMWNECLLKNACYAVNTEKRQNNVYYTNTNKSFLWITAQLDPQTRSLIFSYIRSFLIDYKRLILENKKTFGNINDAEYEIAKMSIAELSNKFDISYETLSNYTKTTSIRINEDGDFLNKEIVKMFDKFAGDISNIGIQSVAYTCRNWNFKSYKNIIVNQSNINNNKESTGNRYYVAVPDAVIRKYYTLPNGALPKNKPTYINGNPTNNIVSVCPCSNGDKKGICDGCKMCYNPIPDDSKNYYILVSTNLKGGIKEIEDYHIYDLIGVIDKSQITSENKHDIDNIISESITHELNKYSALPDVFKYGIYTMDKIVKEL